MKPLARVVETPGPGFDPARDVVIWRKCDRPIGPARAPALAPDAVSLIGVWGAKQTEERGARRRSADADVGRPSCGGVSSELRDRLVTLAVHDADQASKRDAV